MPEPTPPISNQDVFDIAKILEEIGEGISFKHAYALGRLVLEFGGGPVQRKGKRAPFDGVTLGVLQRRGYAEPGGEEAVTLHARVKSVLNLTGSDLAWTASTEVSTSRRLVRVVSASDEAIELVARAWRQHRSRGASQPSAYDSRGEAHEPDERSQAASSGPPDESSLPTQGLPVVSSTGSQSTGPVTGQGSLDLPGIQCWDLFDTEDDDSCPDVQVGDVAADVDERDSDELQAPADPWQTAGFNSSDRHAWQDGEIAPEFGPDLARLYSDADWHPAFAWTLKIFREHDGDWKAERWLWPAVTPWEHALDCARAGFTPEEALRLVGRAQRELLPILERKFETRGPINSVEALFFNNRVRSFEHDIENTPEIAFWERRLWDAQDESDDAARRRGELEPMYGGPHTKKPQWRVLEERASTEVRSQSDSAAPTCAPSRPIAPSDPAEVELEQVWARILSNRDRAFRTKRGVEFSYQFVTRPEDAVIVLDRGTLLTRQEIGHCLRVWPVDGPSDLPSSAATASYLWGILDDVRILGGSQLR